MSWIEDTQKAINYIENNLLEAVNIENVANHIYSSIDHFQKKFHIVTGFSVSEYIRNRRLSLAGQELVSSKNKVIDIALKYGYETPESFTKAFTRFHGFAPSKVHFSETHLKCFNPLTIQINITGGFIMSRKLIPNVERIYENKTENFMLPSCMRSVLYALGEDKSLDFLYFAGACGDLFTQLWNDPKWQYNDSYSQTCHHTVVPIRAAFDACGYDFEYAPGEEIQRNKSKYIQKIITSIDRGVPVLTFGIVGPPTCSIIFGYDENGEVLIGWSQFKDELINDNPLSPYPADNYFQKRNGLEESEALIFIGEKINTPDMADVVRTTIKNIPLYANLPVSVRPTGRTVKGKQAFEAWAESLLDDEAFKGESVSDSPLDTYGSCIVQIGTNMHYMQEYLNKAAALCPDIAQLIYNLKEAYQRVKGDLQKVTDFQGGYFFEADRNVLLRRDYREKLALLVRELGESYMRAVVVVQNHQK